LLPAHRGTIVQGGIYQIVRHPLYAGYLWNHLAFVLAYSHLWNIAVWLLSEGAQMIRLRYEEQLLSSDPAYIDYRQRVRWRVLPGVY
jgi:protein-S-isoprenylcysteine O-methyltransferase Ste14